MISLGGVNRAASGVKIMGLFSFLFPKQDGPPRPPAGMPPMNPQQMLDANRARMRTEFDRRAEVTQDQDLEERVAQLESDLEQAMVVVETLVQLLDEGGTLKREVLAARAKELGAEDVEEILGPETTPAPHPTPVQPTFKKPFVAKRKWDEAAEKSPPEEQK